MPQRQRALDSLAPPSTEQRRPKVPGALPPQPSAASAARAGYFPGPQQQQVMAATSTQPPAAAAATGGYNSYPRQQQQPPQLPTATPAGHYNNQLRPAAAQQHQQSITAAPTQHYPQQQNLSPPTQPLANAPNHQQPQWPTPKPQPTNNYQQPQQQQQMHPAGGGHHQQQPNVQPPYAPTAAYPATQWMPTPNAHGPSTGYQPATTQQQQQPGSGYYPPGGQQQMQQPVQQQYPYPGYPQQQQQPQQQIQPDGGYSAYTGQQQQQQPSGYGGGGAGNVVPPNPYFIPRPEWYRVPNATEMAPQQCANLPLTYDPFRVRTFESAGDSERRADRGVENEAGDWRHSTNRGDGRTSQGSGCFGRRGAGDENNKRGNSAGGAGGRGGSRRHTVEKLYRAAEGMSLPSETVAKYGLTKEVHVHHFHCPNRTHRHGSQEDRAAEGKEGRFNGGQGSRRPRAVDDYGADAVEATAMCSQDTEQLVNASSPRRKFVPGQRHRNVPIRA